MISRADLKWMRDVLASLSGVKVGGTRFRLPKGLNLTLHEPWMHSLISHLIPRTSGVFLDVGVNLGQTLLCLRAVDQDIPYVGFEPNPNCVAATQEIIKQNGLKHVTLLPVACDKAFGLRELFHYLDTRFDDTASLVPNFRSNERLRRSSFVACAPAISTLEQLNIGRLGVVKIDVEGFEADVLEALAPRLIEDKPAIILEILPVGDNSSRQDSLARIRLILDELDYDAYCVEKTLRGGFQRLAPSSPLANHTDPNESDFLLVPKGFEINHSPAQSR